MKKLCVRCLVFAVLALATEHATAQPPEVREMRPNDIGMELIGKTAGAGISYQRMLTPAFGLHVGVGALVGDFYAITCVPVGGTFYLASKKNALFLTGGVVGTSEDIGSLPMYGYAGGGYEFRSASDLLFRYTLYVVVLDDADGQFGNRDGYTGLFELAAYVNDQVPSITMDAFNFEQIPQVHMVGTDFPIGVVKEIDS